MPSHWTYSDFGSDDDLFQGDIISRSSESLRCYEGCSPTSDVNATSLFS